MSEDQPREEATAQPAEDDQRLWSVTTIIDQSSSNRGLIEWVATETAKAAVESLTTLRTMVRNEGEEAAITWLEGARERPRKGQRTAKALGTAIHAACEHYAITGSRPQVDEEVAPFLDRFEAWCQQWQPQYEAAEMTVYCPTYGYAGTLDAILKVDGMLCVADYKTSRKDTDNKGKPRTPWPDVALQLAAYRYAELAAAWRPIRRYEYYRRRYYLLGAEERREALTVPEVEGGLCLYLTPQRCEAYPVVCNEAVHEHFLYAVERARWSLEAARHVLGGALVPGAAHA